MKEALHLLDLVIVDWPDHPAQVPAWADRVSRLLMGPLSANDELPPPPSWWASVDRTLNESHVDADVAFPLWTQVLAFAWSCGAKRQQGMGAVERILLHWWPRVDVHRWPKAWSMDMLSMALETKLNDLAVRMVGEPKPGWSVPPLNEGFQRRHGLSESFMATLRQAAHKPHSGASQGWVAAQSCTSAATLDKLAGLDLTVPVADGPSAPCWPEHHWSEACVEQWPAMSRAMARLRAQHPAAQLQHAAATTWLRIRAIAMGQGRVAQALGWQEWLMAGDLLCAEGPVQTPRHVLDVLSRERTLGRAGRTGHLASMLDHVFQAVQGAPGPTRQALLGERSLPALRFWSRALACAWSQPKSATPKGRRGPHWWRWLMQERPEIWARGVWDGVAPMADDRWLAWLNMAVARSSANPLHLLVVASLSPAHALIGGTFPWTSLPSPQERAWAKACLFQIVWDNAVNDSAQPDDLSRWVMWAIQRRLRTSGRYDIWLPVIWALLGSWEGTDRCPEEARVWRRVAGWVRAHAALAQRTHLQNDHVWSLFQAPRTLARWRDLMARSAPGLDSGRSRVRS